MKLFVLVKKKLIVQFSRNIRYINKEKKYLISDVPVIFIFLLLLLIIQLNIYTILD